MGKEFLLLPGWIQIEDGWRYIDTKEMLRQYNLSAYKCLIPFNDEDPEKIASEFNLKVLKPMRA